MSVERLFDQRLVVCLGSGGVGKTTTAAALAVAGALARRDTAVITVDPARRLKDSLGIADLDTIPRPVPLPRAGGRLEALALDTKRTFDELVARAAPNQTIASAILRNRLYQELSNGLGGSTEYMAMEKLHELFHHGAYDLVVVDTPPSAHARDLLSAPVRMTELLASSAVRFLKTPAAILGSEGGIARMTLSAILKGLQRLTGMNLLQDLSDFATNFEHLADGFRTRAQEVEAALRSPSTSFLLVTTPEPDTIESTIEFHRELERERFPVAGVIANRVHRFPELAAGHGAGYPEALRRKLLANYGDFRALSDRDARALERLARETRLPLLAVLPVFDTPPASRDGLERFAELLVENNAGRASASARRRSSSE